MARLDVPVPQILIEVEMLDVSRKTADLLGVKFGDTIVELTGGTQRTHQFPFNTKIKNATGAGTITSADQLSAVLQFLRTQTDTRNLARPRIITLNNETAQIKIATDESIGVITETTASEGVSTSSTEAERVETGVVLTVTPQANLETNEITMAIVPKVIQTRQGDTFQGQSFKDPEERGSKSILRVNDGDTIVLGGLVRIDSEDVRTKLPLLGDIPFLGAAFRHKDREDTERELIIFITPHIITEKEAAKLSDAHAPSIFREQDFPSQRLQEINKTLATVEYQRL
jgi:type II secretory pathway component GspD/PulD (secretin)